MADYWMNADWYNSIASNVPSDKIAYSALFDDLRVEEGRRILHFGCHQGTTTKAMQRRGANVVGIDKSHDSITKAKNAYDDIRFEQVAPYEPISPGLYEHKRFDAVAMPFVTPTIDNQEEIQAAMNKSYEALGRQGKIGVLGLHPNSFNDAYKFKNYDHEAPASFQDGKPFQNTIQTKEGATVQFTDHYWRPSTLERLLERSGFQDVETVEVTKDAPGIGDTVTRAAKAVQETRGLEDELRAPLYKLIHGHKPSHRQNHSNTTI